MKLWTLVTLCTASLLIINGCAAKPTPKKAPIIDETLPTVKLTKNGVIVDVNVVALEWVAIDDQRVKGVYIYKNSLDEKSDNKDEYYDTIDNRFSTHYVDSNVKPNSTYQYYFKTYSDKAESRKSEAVLVTTLPPMDSVAWIHSIQNMPRSAKIIWRPHINQKVKSYIVQRRTLKAEYWEDIATIEGRLNAEYIDKNLKDNFTYIYRIRAVTYDNLTSKPSKEVKIITKALPNELKNIKATTDLPRKIMITWEKTDTKDFLKYNIYRSSNVDGDYKLIRSLKENSYVDIIKEDGKQYFYRVSVVDKDGLESVHHNYSIQGTTLVKPKTPSLVEAKLIDGKVKISWSDSDSRIESYIVQKKYKKSLLDNSIEDFEDIRGAEFIDTEIMPDKVYYYKVFGVDKHGIKSEPSIEVELKVGKLLSPDNFKPNKQKRKTETKTKTETKKKNTTSKEDVITPTLDFN